MLTSPSKYLQKGNKYYIKNADIFVLAAMGYKEGVAAKIARNASLIDAVDDCNRTPMYLAARGGFKDIVELLIQKGADLNKKQNINSTPLHAAAYFGQSDVVRMLLVYGADPTRKNNYGNTPYDEAFVNARKIFDVFHKEPVKLAEEYFFHTTSQKMKCIYIPGKLIGYEIFRSMSLLDYHTKLEWEDMEKTWEVAFHGTQLRHVNSILTHGLIPSGSHLPSKETLKPPSGHIKLNATCHGVDNWAKAILASPSVMYASHPAYTEYCGSGDAQWCVVLKVYVNPSANKEYIPTAYPKEDSINGDPNELEYQIDKPRKEDLSDLTEWHQFCINVGCLESEKLRNVVVASVLFLKTSFRKEVKKQGLTFQKLHACF